MSSLPPQSEDENDSYLGDQDWPGSELSTATISDPDYAQALIRQQIQRTLVITETAFLASAAALIWLIDFYVPAGPLLRIFFPIPVALIYLRWHRRAAWMGAIVSALLLSVLMGPPRSLQYLLPHGILGVVLGGLWKRKAPWPLSLWWGAVLGSVGFFFQILVVSALLGENLWVYVNQQVTGFLDWILVQLGILVIPSFGLIQVTAVVLVFCQSYVYALIVHMVAWRLLARLGNPIPDPPAWLEAILVDRDV